MKLVEVLAAEMDVWPDGVTHLTQSNVDREIYDARDGNKEDSVDSLNPRFDTMKRHTEDSYPIVTRAQWQAERDRQKGGEWKRHRGGKQPVRDNQRVEVKFRDGAIEQSHASDFFGWRHGELEDRDAHIMQYRVVSQPQAEEVGVHKLIQDIGVYSHQGEIIHGPISIGDEVIAPAHPKWEGVSATQDYSVGQWHQIDGPILWRDTLNELDAYIEEFTREREALIERLASEGFALLPAMTAVMGVADSIIPIEDWQIGDILEVVARKGANSHEFEIGEHVRIDGFDLDDDNLPVKCYALDESDFWYLKYEEAKFIRRP